MKQRLQEKVKNEYALFQNDMLHNTKEEIFNSVCIIRFYAHLYEYFYYNDSIPESIQKLAINNSNLLEWLWILYLKYEQFSIESWSSITDFLIDFCKGGLSTNY